MTKNTEKHALHKNFLFLILLAILAIWMGMLCFYHLDAAVTHNWDEARHITNAYEMMSYDNLWIHTYRGEVDYYNYKPPLSMWCIIFFFKLFGTNFYSMRLYSAVAMFLTFLLVSGFLLQNFGRRAAILFGLLLTTGEDLFFFHMARSADADALYILLFSVAMLCLYMTEKQPWYICLCCFFLSLSFLAKCLHMATGIAIIVCYLPRIYKRMKIKHYAAGGLCLAIPAGIWALIRFHYDGLTFFIGMIGQEVVKRIRTEQDYTLYIQYFLEKPLLVIPLCASAFAALCMVLINWKSVHLSNHTIVNTVRKLINHKLYLFFLWFLIPLCIYSASGAFMCWYFYICYIPFYIICGAVLGRFTTFYKRSNPLPVLVLLILLACVGSQTRENIINLNRLSDQYDAGIRHDLTTLVEQYPDCKSSRIYIENSKNEYNAQNAWEQNCVADAYITGDFHPINGGVPVFREDEDSLLVISKNLFSDYSSVLAGRVILVDGNEYLIFSNEFYE